jgi:hypothetical protein
MLKLYLALLISFSQKKCFYNLLLLPKGGYAIANGFLCQLGPVYEENPEEASLHA